METRQDLEARLVSISLPEPSRRIFGLLLSDMLSPNNARPQQSARRAYLCLSNCLHHPRHDFATTTSVRNTHSNDTKDGNPTGELARAFRWLDYGPRNASESPQAPRLVGPRSHKLVRGHYSDAKPRKVNRRMDAIKLHSHEKSRDAADATIRQMTGLINTKAENTTVDQTTILKSKHVADDLIHHSTTSISNRKNDFEGMLRQHTAAQDPESLEAILGHQGIHAAKKYARPIETLPAALSSLSGTRSTATVRPTTAHMSMHNSSYKGIRSYHKQAVAPLAKEAKLPPLDSPNGVRSKLRRWQEEHGKDMEHLFKDNLPAEDDVTSSNLSRLGDVNYVHRAADDKDEEQQAMAHFARSQADDPEGDVTDARFMFMGDLVDIEFDPAAGQSMLAVFVRRIGPSCQFYTINGRWLHLTPRAVQYTIPGWVSQDLVKPLLEYLPSDEQLKDMEALKQDAYINDLSVPRHVAAPLVSRLVAFNRESLEIYRKNASTLDRAHDILAHQNDLRYGSLVSAATTLLKIPSDKLPLTAIYTVRKALMQAGFAFNIDRRSHRLTGYLQIRSKDQVRMVEQVRGWLREWQEDLATKAVMNPKQQQRHVPSKGAAHVYRFIDQAKAIVTASRETREPTQFGNIGPSKIKRVITPDQEAVKIHADYRFNEYDQELVRFMEAWCCSNMFDGLPRITALPPLILQATGLYADLSLGQPAGYMFLQELGTIMPYENRIRFDQHLLLPSSQHSKPLQTLMYSLLEMKDEPDFSDVMKHLRHDWGDLPVYCIDDASAQEIDDGLSVERANPTDSQSPEWWVHVHIANPTAFFDRHHPLAKMARHMGETIYTPERTYVMLPRWATQRHFSLGKDRPCLTFSARLNEHGEVLDSKIRPGYIKNVHRLTPDETIQLVGLKRSSDQTMVELTVGGTPPPARERTSAVPSMNQRNIDDLKMLQKLAEKRTEVRRASGGVFFDSQRPAMTVWQRWIGTGLAWDHPHRKGGRTVEGDPVINMKTYGLKNWFAATDSMVDILVREMMLLACNISTEWCAARQIPTIYRGSVPKPDSPDPKHFYRTVCEPAMARNGGDIPMHIGIEYIKTQGSVILNTEPLRHNLLGLNHYGKVTSPLRRYGDMILHWQIEAALRQEAQTGKSLLTSGPSLSGIKPNRDFLPFSPQSLQTIMLGLQPREQMITRAKASADSFWIAMLLFRAHHFGETKLPFETCHAYIPAEQFIKYGTVAALLEELNVGCEMLRPEKIGTGMPEAKSGDRWECTLESVDVFRREIHLKPFRLVSRWE